MAYEALTGGTSEGDPISEGQQLQAALLCLNNLIMQDVVDRFPVYDPRAEQDALDACEDLHDLLIDRINYDPALDESMGIDGFHCAYMELGKICFKTMTGYKLVHITLSAEGGVVRETSEQTDYLPIYRHKALKSQGEDSEALDCLLNAPKSNEVADAKPITTRDILGTYAPKFVPRVLQKMRQTEIWFKHCRENGLDPFTDEAW